MVALVKNCPTVSYQDHTLHAPPPPPTHPPHTHTNLYEIQKYLSQLQITLIFLISHISSCSYQAVQMIEYSRKAQTQSQERIIQLLQLILLQSFSWILAEFYFNRGLQRLYTGTCIILQKQLTGFFVCLLFFLKVKRIS